MNMRIICLTVAKNEARRYLADFLDWTSTFVDGHFLYDDQSTDCTSLIAGNYATVRIRPDDVPSFLDHEGVFRQAAYRAMEEDLVPQDEDWILVLDCDEFLVAKNERGALEDAIGSARQRGATGVTFPVIEIFGRTDERLGQRVDGYWKSITASRLFLYKPRATFSMARMGGGCVPLNVDSTNNTDISLLHLGYLNEGEREGKYERYVSVGNHGHNPSHIRSILTPPKLESWKGKVPPCLM